MKILNRLTIKHLFMNKKRTIVTIIGITLSMALMLGCGLLASSFIEELRNEAIESNGSYHAVFKNVDEDMAKTIQNNINVETSYFISSLGYANFNDTENISKPYYHVVSGNQKMLETFHLMEGRLPKNENEIIISDHIRYNAYKDIKVGDTLTLDVGTRMLDGEPIYINEAYTSNALETEKIVNTKTMTYQVVGIIARPYIEDYSAPGYTVFTYSDHFNEIANILYVEFFDTRKVYEIGNDIQETLGLELQDIDYNYRVLYYYGTTKYNNVNQSILSVLSIALSLLSIGCIIVIYNSFAISTMERKKQFGLYSSIGATRKQILHTVFFEAFLVGIIGIILGIIGSFVGIYIVLEILNYLLQDIWEYHFTLVINWIYILVPIIFMILVIFFSAFIPARRASKVSPIEAIRENDDIKMPRKKLKTPKFITKIFGIEGELALKNMKRNKKKYRITVLSLFISIVLFISFSAYMTYALNTMQSIDNFDYDIVITGDDDTRVSTLQDITKDPRITKAYFFENGSFVVKVQPDVYASEYRKYRQSYYMNEPFDFVNLNFIILEDADFQEYANKVSAKMDDFIVVNEGQFVFYDDSNRFSYHKELFQTKNSSLMLCQYDDIEKCDVELPNVVYTNEVLPTFHSLLYSSGINGFISRSRYQELISNQVITKNLYPYYTVQIQSLEYEDLYRDLKDEYKKFNFIIFSPKEELKEQKNIILAIKILLYGFITLVSLIGVTSVFNTIHTSINLRRKEFAMLRSMGLAPNGFNKMILFESLFFGFKSLLYGLPVSFIVICFIRSSMMSFTNDGKFLVPWGAVIFSIIGVFFIVLLAMWYSVYKIKKENILNAIRDENI